MKSLKKIVLLSFSLMSFYILPATNINVSELKGLDYYNFFKKLNGSIPSVIEYMGTSKGGSMPSFSVTFPGVPRYTFVQNVWPSDGVQRADFAVTQATWNKIYDKVKNTGVIFVLIALDEKGNYISDLSGVQPRYMALFIFNDSKYPNPRPQIVNIVNESNQDIMPIMFGVEYYTGGNGASIPSFKGISQNNLANVNVANLSSMNFNSYPISFKILF